MTASEPLIGTADPEIDRQSAHYDRRYSQVDVRAIVARINNLDDFFNDAVRTDTSWYGLYYGGFAEQLSGRRILELGCGDGLNALVMAAKGARVIAIDISGESKRIIDTAAGQLGLHADHIQALTGDFRDLDLQPYAPFDMIVGKAFLHHLTPEQEREYLAKCARLLRPDGEARFFEPAENSQLLDTIRWTIPMGRRPSSLRREAFARWSERDPHPERSNHTNAFFAAASDYFGRTEVVPVGSIERFHRLLPHGNFERSFRRWAHRVDRKLPGWIRRKFARSQTLIYRQPLPANADGAS